MVKVVSTGGNQKAKSGGMGRDFPFFLFFFLADLSYVGFVLFGDVLDIQRWKTNFTFVSKNKFSPMDLFLS